MSNLTTDAMTHLENQREYVKRQQLDDQRTAAARSTGRSGIVDERMLAISMRSVRYADEAHAGADLVDNAIESGASQVHIAYKAENSKIVELAFIDDGSGIVPEFLPHATKWGGSSNQGKRNLFGRFGFGLPSASVNRCRAYDVYSRTSASEPFSAVTVDLDNLVGEDGVVPLPQVIERDLPSWIQAYVNGQSEFGDAPFAGGLDAVRTVVVWRNPDRLSWGGVQQSSARFREHFGVTYASWLSVVTISVGGKLVEPTDVLFTTPGYRWYDIDGFAKAEPQSTIVFDAKAADGNSYPVKVRFSYISADALSASVASEGKGARPKVRMRLRKEYNGFFVTRHGRFIELVRSPLLTWSVYARQVGVAIDFPPELDELFGVTPDKQSVQLSPALESLLDTHGVVRAFRSLERQVADERAELRRRRDEELAHLESEFGKGTRPSEEVIAKVVERDIKRRRKAPEETIDEADRNLRRRIKEVAEASDVDEKEAAKLVEKRLRTKPYRVDFKPNHEDQPFYTPYMEGPQMVLEINTDHPWYREVYAKLTDQQAELRSSLELFLWVLGIQEVDASGENRVFYRNERRTWSDRLADALDLHPTIFHVASSTGEVEDLDERPWEGSEDEEASDNDELTA